jgi:hypothetical protein
LYSTEIYQYIPRQLVVIDTGSSPRRYENVYAKTLKLHKGSDNRLQFQFLNQEQKPVDITGKEITIRIISYDNSKILLQKSLVNTLSLTGIAELRLNADNLSDINTQKCYYSLELPDELGLNVPGLMDKNGTGRGDIDIVNSIYPARIPAQRLSILHDTTPGAPAGTYYSSILTTQYSPKITMQLSYDGYVGTVTIQGSTNGTSNWYDIEMFDYTDPTTPTTGSEGYTVEGYHPYINVKFDSTIGNVTNIIAR